MTADPISFNSERISSVQSAIDDSVQTAIAANAESTQQMIDSAVQSAIESNNESLQQTIDSAVTNAITTNADVQQAIDSAVAANIGSYHSMIKYDWNTSNGIDPDDFDASSSITLICNANIRHLIGKLQLRSAISTQMFKRALTSNKLSIEYERYISVPGLDCYLVLNNDGLKLYSNTMTISSDTQINFSYTYLSYGETEVRTTE